MLTRYILIDCTFPMNDDCLCGLMIIICIKKCGKIINIFLHVIIFIRLGGKNSNFHIIRQSIGIQRLLIHNDRGKFS